jgi:transcriptional regulator with XRE-family HTH domain
MITYKYDKMMGERIRALRERANLTQEQLSAKLQVLSCDITRSALAKIEVGQRHIYSYEIHCLKKALGTTYEELFPSR